MRLLQYGKNLSISCEHKKVVIKCDQEHNIGK